LYRVARELGCNKIALGHHRDDILQTLLLNMFFGAKLKGMPAKLVSDNGEFMVLRPLAYVAEPDLVRWAQVRQFPIIPCNLCGSQDNLQRVQVGQMLREWERQHPGRLDNMLKALQSVVPSHLMDRALFPFETLQTTGQPIGDGDTVFDAPDPPAGPATPMLQSVALPIPTRAPTGPRANSASSHCQPADQPAL